MMIELFLLDELLLNLLIVRLAAALLSVRPPLYRQLGAAVCSALTSALAAYLWPWLTSVWARPLLLGLMASALPVKGAGGFARAMGAVLFSTLVIGGAVLAFALASGGGVSGGFIEGGITLRAAVISFALASFLPAAARRILRRRIKNEVCVRVAVLHRGVLRSFVGMVDTGNTLAEPISGLPVVVIRCRALEPYAKLPLPVVTAAGRGSLNCFRPEKVSVSGTPVDCMVAVTRERISAEAIVPPELAGENGDRQSAY